MMKLNGIKTKSLLLCLLLCCMVCGGADAGRFSWDKYKSKPDTWYRSDEGRRVAENILSFQDDYGAWPKNIDTASEKVSEVSEIRNGTFDNGATTGEMRFMARAYKVTNETCYQEAFLRALDLILKVQYPTGGWPQCYPPGEGYPRHITFNDDAMVRIMTLLQDITHSEDYDFVGAERRAAVQKAFNRGIECILKCQIRVDGKLKVWCAQYDEKDYSPRPARTYELVSLSGGESAGILRLLMSLDKPTPEVVKAITAGVDWYKEAHVEGIRAQWVDGKFSVVQDPDAPPAWGRFCEIDTDRPFFCNRDGIPRHNFDEIDEERATKYRWYGYWGQEVFADYEKWSRRWGDLQIPERTKMLAIIGDSTVCDFPEDDLRRGWGQYIQGYFTESIKVVSKARSGRSTKTFIQQGLWKQVLDMKPDYILIQFGHNDSHAPEKPESTNAATDYQDYLRQYVDQSRQIGAIPILVTPMYRRKFDDAGRIKDNLLPYANAMKQVAAEKDVPIIDLNAASEKLYLQLGESGCMELANAPDDRTHFNEKGAKIMANLVIQQLQQAEPSLKQYHIKSR